MMTQNNDIRLKNRNSGFSDFYEKISDPALRDDLQRIEVRIVSFANDVLDGWLGMAEEFHKAKEKLSNQQNGHWGEWVTVCLGGFVSIDTANKLAEIGKLERSELAALRATYFQKGSGISAIAAFLAAPESVKDQVKGGGIKATSTDIERAARAFKEAQEAQARAEEAEHRARLAEANFEAQVQEVRREALMQGQLEVQKATAQLQRDVDEARHQAALRQRDMQEAQQQIQRAQAEWDSRLAYATKQATEEERQRLETAFTKQMTALQAQLKEQEKAARDAQRQANEINERLTRARDSEAIRARWDVLAIDLADKLDAALKNFPSVTDAQYFEAHERTLTESLVARLEIVLRRVKELNQSSAVIVDAG